MTAMAAASSAISPQVGQVAIELDVGDGTVLAPVLELGVERVRFLVGTDTADDWLRIARRDDIARMTVRVHDGVCTQRVPVSGDITRAQPTDDGVLVTAALDEETQARLRPMTALLRRRHRRFRPPASHPVTAVLYKDSGRVLVRGMVRDLSASGAGVLIPVRLASRVRQHSPLRLALHLDGQDAPFASQAHVRYELLDQILTEDGFAGPGVALVGMEFERGGADPVPGANPLHQWLAAQVAR